MIALKTMRKKRAMCLFIGCYIVRRHWATTYFAKNASSTLSVRFLSSPQMTQTKRRKSNSKKKKKKEKK